MSKLRCGVCVPGNCEAEGKIPVQAFGSLSGRGSQNGKIKGESGVHCAAPHPSASAPGFVWGASGSLGRDRGLTQRCIGWCSGPAGWRYICLQLRPQPWRSAAKTCRLVGCTYAAHAAVAAKFAARCVLCAPRAACCALHAVCACARYAHSQGWLGSRAW